MVSLLLAEKIAELFLMMLAGVALVRLKLLRSEDSRILSTISVYLIMPSVCISAFQVDANAQVAEGLRLAVLMAILMNLLAVICIELLAKPLHLDAVEKTNAIYSNAGNILIPIVVAILGQEYVIYTCAYGLVMQFLIWSHCRMTLCGERCIDFKKIFCNVNMLSVLIGFLPFLLHIQLPPLIQETLQSLGNLVGPIPMLVTGMLIGGMDVKKIFTYRRVWLIAFLRLILLPLMSLVILKSFLNFENLIQSEQILLITLIAASGPSAAAITQIAQLYNRDAEYASANNILTTLLCIVTMPLMVLLFYL